MTTNGLRIAVLSVHTCPLATPGGWETGGMNVYIRELSRQLGTMDVQVDVFTRRQDSRSPDVVPFGSNARVIHLEAGPRRPIDKYEVLDYLPEFTCGIQRFRALTGSTYDLVHSHYWLSGRVAAVLKEVWGVPLVTMFHTLARVKNQAAIDTAEKEEHIRGEIEARMMKTSDRIIAATEVDRAHMLSLYQASARKISVIPPGVNLDRFRLIPQKRARRKLGLNPDQALILFVGRLQQIKGIDLLMETLPLLDGLSDKGRGAQLLVVGGLPPTASGRRSAAEERQIMRLRKLALQLGVEPRVRFVGAVAHDSLPLYYSAADVTVMPSAYESFGLVALESLACGTPVIATRVGGLPSIVRHGETGFLVPWRHPRLFAERIAELLDDTPLRAQMGQRGLAAIDRFSWTHVAFQVQTVYEELLSRTAAASSDSLGVLR